MGDVDYINETIMEVAAPYAASKAALSTVFAKLNAAYQDQGILFMSICPGIVDTDATKMPDTEKEAARMQLALVKLQKYADEGNSSLALVAPTVSATNCLNLIESSSLEGGHGGSFRSHNGTRRWI
jgi:NAD(P)-dependent dehydrogenase (short-subunit alcohol dehydrogenase family)